MLLGSKKTVILISFLTIASCNLLVSQAQIPDLPTESGERIQLFCDRDMYCVTENIFFSAYYSLNSRIGQEEWSTILYAELINWDGTKIAQIKVPIIDGLAQGSIRIPKSIRSGNYYFRAYTKWMRNYSPYLYKYIPLKIINPSTDEIDNGYTENESRVLISRKKEQGNTGKISVKGLNNNYASRELIAFDLTIQDKQFSGQYLISVAKTNNKDNLVSTFSVSGYEDEASNEQRIEFLPELKNITLDGIAIDKTTREPISGKEIVLCSTLNPFYFYTSKSDDNGTFIFLIPAYEGNHQFCLKSLTEDEKVVEFLIRSDFCNREISLPYVPFELSPLELITARDISTNAQLNSKFSIIDSIEIPEGDFRPFYGKVKDITYLKDYVELIDLREFFYEIMPEVIVDTKNKEPFVRLQTKSSLAIFPPLILLDNIPVPNDEVLLSIPGKNLSHIEIINGGYIVNNTMFSGIISIFSNNRDLGGLVLSGDEQFFNFQLLSHSDLDMSSDSGPGASRSANMQNLLYFDPNIELSTDKSARIRFHTSDALGEYTITLRGIGQDGTLTVVDQFEFIVD